MKCENEISRLTQTLTPLAGINVVVAMSGGVDSSVAAILLSRAGANVIGITMTHRLMPINPACEEITRMLKIPLHKIDVTESFDQVVTQFVSDYYAARTPNPCVLCNAHVKFGVLAQAARRIGGDNAVFATGHYARLENGKLLTAFDTQKDQSYVLHRMPRESLALTFFPLGSLTKNGVRAFAEAMKLPLHNARESQDICFIPDGDYSAFLQQYQKQNACKFNENEFAETAPRETSGFFVNADGKSLAPHAGYERFTIGQRKGFGVGFGRRVFVTAIDAASRNVTLGDYHDLACEKIAVRDVHLLIDANDAPEECEIKIRYRSAAQRGKIAWDHVARRAQIEFFSPVFAVAPGQAAVFYQGNHVLGGGIIEK